MGLTGHALTTGGFAAAFVAFVVAAVAIALLVFGLALTVARAQEETVKAVRAGIGQVKRFGGYILIGVGGWLIALAVFAEFFARYFAV